MPRSEQLRRAELLLLISSDHVASFALSSRAVSKLTVDPEKTHVRIRTFAEGLFSRLAHDLELVCRGVEGTAERPSAETGSATLSVPIAKIDIAGTLKHGRVDPAGLSPSDREDALRKMRRDVFHAKDGTGVVRVEATLEAGRARVRVIPPNGRSVERPASVRLEPGDMGARVSGSFELSLDALGSDPVKGPMNAFRVKDSVEILFDVFFREAR